MQLSQISLALTRLGGVPFGPASLFAAGEQGAWYDPSDLTTLFQDSAGTTPVTAVEQSVGLMLDKSKGLALGSELVSNPGPGFTTTTGWTSGRGATLSVVSGAIRVTNTAAYGQAYATITTVVGAWYKVTVSATNPTTTFDIILGSTGPETGILYQKNSNASGTYTFYFLATTTTSYLTLGNSGTTAGNSFDLVSATLKALPGNHAYQSTSTSRPVLRARYNLLTYSEQFDNAAWTKGAATVTANTSIAPDGTTTADTFTSTNTSQQHYLQPTAASALTTYNLNYTGSISVKAGTHNFITVSFSSGGATTWAAVTVNLSTGVITQTGNGAAGTLVSSSISAQGNGWYRVSLTASYSSGGPGTFLWVSSSSSGTPTYGNYGMETWLAAGTETILVWGADLRPASQVNSFTPSYQRIAAATDYNTTGFLPYLAFDGTDDSLLTNSVDFTATDKMTVWAGVRKLIGTASVIAELSSNTQTDNGSFVLANAFVSATTYDVQVRGTDRNARSYSAYTAPVTNVLQTSITTAAADSPSAMQTRVDGAVNAGSSFLSVVSTGNFGNYPIYIGRRNNATLPFNGWLTSLIIRGAQSTASQISSTETWVAQKTGVTL